jgi:uncharacterized Zn finger protein (UPF0148 family)
MENNEQPKMSFAERMRQKALEQKNYGHEAETPPKEAKMDARDCPNCGAGRAQQDGLTHCAYCGFEFMSAKLTDGIHIRKENNSQ